MKHRLACIVAAVLGLVMAGMAQEAGKPAPGFTLKDTLGREHALAEYKGKYVVLEWTNYDCPFVKKHYETEAMQQLQKAYIAQGVVWLSVCSSAPGKQGHFTVEQWAERMAKVQAAPTAVLLDADGKVGKAYGAKNTPEIVVISPEGVVLYQGAIDNQPGLDRSIMKDAVNYVRATLDAAMAGKPVEVTKTAPYGCTVKY
jgi:peroxiredoxin